MSSYNIRDLPSFDLSSASLGSVVSPDTRMFRITDQGNGSSGCFAACSLHVLSGLRKGTCKIKPFHLMKYGLLWPVATRTFVDTYHLAKDLKQTDLKTELDKLFMYELDQAIVEHCKKHGSCVLGAGNVTSKGLNADNNTMNLNFNTFVHYFPNIWKLSDIQHPNKVHGFGDSQGIFYRRLYDDANHLIPTPKISRFCPK